MDIQENNGLENNGLENNSLKIHKYLLMALATLLAGIILLVLFLSVFKNTQEKGALLPTEDTSGVESDSPVMRELSGTVMSIDPSGEFMRVAVPNEGTFSIGLKGYTSDQAESGSALSEIALMSTVSFTVEVAENTDRYDYVVEREVAESVVTEPVSEELTIEERLERLRELSANPI